MLKNYKLLISYDGSRFFGWEHQPNKEWTIQGKIETVLAKMLDFPEGKIPKVIGAGRTDAGVHAKEMVANVNMDTSMEPEEIQTYMNKYLPEDISINQVRIASDRFHARYNAVGKTYCYSFYYGESKPVFDRKYVLTLDRKPNIDKMKEAAELMTGKHDYKSFCGNSHMKKSTVRIVDSIEIKQKGPYIRMYFHGTGFLQNMVRIMSGTILLAGYGDIKTEEIPGIIEAKDRNFAGPTLPGKGLMLIKVDY